MVGCPRLFGKGRALRRIMRAERIRPAQVVYIGDEVRDMEAARSVGVTAVAATWGFQSEDVLRASGPAHVAASPGEVAALLSTEPGTHRPTATQ